MSNLNFPSSRPIGGTGPLKAVSGIGQVVPAQSAQQAASARVAQSPSARAGESSQLHMAAQEMESHVTQALEQSPVLNDEQAPLIDLEHLDAPPEEQEELETPEPEAEGENFEPIEFAEAEAPEEPEDKEAGQDSEGGEGGADPLESYLAAELKLYLEDREIPARRLSHLLKNAQEEERPREAATAVACEALLGGLARSQPNLSQRGAFTGLKGVYLGKSFGLLSLTNPAQLQPFTQALRKALARPDLDFMLLDLEKLQPQHQTYVLKTLPASGARPQQVLVFLGAGKCQWN